MIEIIFPCACLILGAIFGMIAGLKLVKPLMQGMMQRLDELECRLMQK